MEIMFALLLTQATPYPGGDFMYSGGRCLELVQTGAIHWGLQKSECAKLVKLNEQLNRVYRAKLKTLSAPRRALLRRSQRAWLATMNEACGMGDNAKIIDEDASVCFSTKTARRIAEIRNF